MPKGQPNGDRVIWDDAQEKHLLLVILAVSNPTGLDWATIANQFGGSLTASAASQKYGKIKKRDADLFNGVGSGSTPSKGKGTGTPNATSKRGRAKVASVEDDDEEMGTPLEEAKETPKKERKDSRDDSGSPVKNEDEDEYDYGGV